MARACRFTAPYGSREIYLDGKPFFFVQRHVDKDGNGPRPTDVDSVSKEILKLLCGAKKTKSALARAVDPGEDSHLFQNVFRHVAGFGGARRKRRR